MPKAVSEFSRFANQYNQYNMVQEDVAKKLVSGLSRKYYQNIIDFGCGSGGVYRNIKKQHISFDSFMALDSSKEMLSIHPSDTKVKKIHANFNSSEAYQKINLKKETILISSSALQWSEDLDFTFSHLASLTKSAYFAIFTSGTFHTLHLTAGTVSPIYTKERLRETIERYYDATFMVKSYRLEFKTVSDMFKYIKKSGVNGGDKQLDYNQVKKLMHDYPLN